MTEKPGGNSNGSSSRTSPIIELIMTEGVKKEQIATECFYHFKSKSINLRLNHKYPNILVDLPLDLKDLEQSDTEIFDILEGYGVTPEDSQEIREMIISNNGRIIDHYRQQELEQTSVGQQKRKERNDRLKNAPPRLVSVSQALMMDEGNVLIKGMFVGGSAKVEKMYAKIGLRCANCYEPTILTDYSERPRLQSEIPREFTPKYLSKQKCEICDTESIKHEPYQELVTALRVELRDEETSNDPPCTDVILFGVLPNDVPWNEPVRIIGSIQQVRIKDKYLPHVFVYGTDHIDRVEEIESAEITDDDNKRIQEFLDNHKNEELLDTLAELHTPSHIGDNDVKKGLLICAASTGLGPKRRINVLLLGETGLDKTGLAKGATRTVLGSKFASAMDSTTNSLICVVDGDSGHFRFGPIVTANNAICVVDEVGRMPKEEQARLLSAMGPDGTVYFARFGIHRDLPATEGFILTANPDSISGRFRNSDKADIEFKIDSNELPFLGPFRDRIDLVFISKQDRDPSYLWKYGESKFEDDDNRIALLKKEGENYQFLRKWILKGKEIVDIRFSEEAKCMITEYFAKVMEDKNSQSSNRLHDTLRKCCIAVVRLKLKETVEAEDAREVIEFYNKQLKYWSQIKVDISHDIRDHAYDEINKKLSSQPFKSEFIELLKAVCEDNSDIDEYLKKTDRKTGKRIHDWSVGTNVKIRQIRDKFVKGPRDVYMILDISPLTLACRKTYRGSDKEVTIDEIDKIDTIDIDGKPNEKIFDKTSVSTKPETSNGYVKSVNNVNKPDNTNTGGKSKISDGDENPDINYINHINLPSKQDIDRDPGDVGDTGDMAGKPDEKNSDSSNASPRSKISDGDENPDVTNVTSVTESDIANVTNITKPDNLDLDESDKIDTIDIDGKPNERISDNSPAGSKSKISDEDINHDITSITSITLPSKQELTKVDPTQSGQNGLEYNSKEIPLEDYKTYTARQAEKVRAVEREEEARRIFDRLASKNVEENPGAEKEVLESKFREVLISSGISDIDVIINDMTEKDGPIERVVTELGDILRLKGDFYKNGSTISYQRKIRRS